MADPNSKPNQQKAGEAPVAGFTAPSNNDIWSKIWASYAPQAAANGTSEAQARATWEAAGMPTDGGGIQKALSAATNPTHPDQPPAPVTPDAGLVQDVRSAAGLNHGTSANDVTTLDRPDPVQQALDALRNAGALSAQQQQQAMQGAQQAGNANAAQQQDLITMLRQAASGGGPSAAEALFQLALGKNINAQQAAAAGVRGGNAAAAARNAGIAGGQMMDQSRDAAAALRAGEQATAQQTLGGVLAQARGADIQKAATVADIAAQVRGQDIGQAAQVAGLTQAAAALDQAKKQAAAGSALSLLQLDTGTQQQNIANLLSKAGLVGNYDLGSQGLEIQRQQLAQQKEQADRAFITQLLGSIIGAGATFGAGALSAPSAVTAASKWDTPVAPPPVFSTKAVFGSD